MRRRLSLALLLAALLCAISAMPAPAATLKVDFESGPPPGTAVNDDYLSTAFVRWVQADPGFRAYRRSAPGQAKSGDFAADVGSSDVCFAENPGNAGDCEFYTPSSTARLTRTATKVTLFAGLFSASGTPITVHLVAYDAGDNPIATGPDVIIDETGFDKPVTVTDAGGRIARFDLLSAPDSTNAPIGYDDLTIDFPANGIPDFSFTAPQDTAAVLQGRTTSVPLTITRLNGSDGPISFTVGGLPPGVTGEVVPNPASGTAGAATLKLTAAPDAATFEVPQSVTVTATPGDANAGSGPRSATVPIRVAAPFVLRTPAGTSADLPLCVGQSVPVQIARDRSFGGTVTLSLDSVPAGVQVATLPQTFAPGGGFTIETSFTLSAPPGAALPATVTLRASSPDAPGAPDRTIALTLTRATPTATIETTEVSEPQRLLPGTEVRVRGNGFCPGTDVRFSGTGVRPDAVSVEDGGHLLRFRTPRDSRTGPLDVLVPGVSTPLRTANSITRVSTYNNTNGFQFGNFPYEYLSWGELIDLVGADDVFIKINPCWPWGHCSVITPVPNPLTEVEWGVLNLALRSTGGHCFGISRTVQLLLAGKVGYSDFTPGAEHVFDLASPSGPTDKLSSFLDSQHAAQGTREFLDKYVSRGDFSLDALRTEIGKGHPIISLSYTRPGDTLPVGHAMVAYDVSTEPDGKTDVWVFDNNRPASTSDPSALHKIVFEPDGKSWSFDLGGETWSGGARDIFMMPRTVIPDDPSLPGLGDLLKYGAIMIFGSGDGAARSTGSSTGASFIPTIDGSGPGGAGGTWVAPNGQKQIAQTMEGLGDGTYSQVVLGNGFAGAVQDVKTAKGVKDTFRGATGGHEVAFEGGSTRPLHLELLSGNGGDTARTATIDTTTVAGGGEIASLSRSGTLALHHQGKDEPLRFTLTDVRPDGGVTRFTSPALRVRDGDQVTATPGKGLDTVKLVVKKRSGAKIVRTLRDRTRTRSRLTVGKPKLTGRRATFSVRVSRLTQPGTLGIALRAVRGKRTVKRATFALNGVGNGRRTIRRALPKLGKGRFRIVADVTLVSAGTEPGAARAAPPEIVRRSAATRVRVK